MGYTQTCSKYNAFNDQKGCEESFNDTPVGQTSDTSGDSQGCRMYHLNAAKSDAATHCDHAAGVAVCVAPMETTSSPMTAAFCMAYTQTCSNYPAFSDQKGCEESFNDTPVGATSDTSGDSQGCRMYHLGAAKGNPALHCDHAAGLAVCVAPMETTMSPTDTPMNNMTAAGMFCMAYAQTCANYPAFSDQKGCMESFNDTPVGAT